MGVTRQLAGRAFRSNLFYFAKRRTKKGFPLQSLTQLEYIKKIEILKFF
jgi:hypothetical protein